MGQLTNNRLIINEAGNVFLVKSGSTTTGVSQSLSIPFDMVLSIFLKISIIHIINCKFLNYKKIKSLL